MIFTPKTIVYTLSIIALFIGLQSCSEAKKLKLIGLENKEVIREGMHAVITVKGEELNFEDCKSTCKKCDPLYIQRAWKVDTIKESAFVLTKVITYKYDTIQNTDFKKRSKIDKKTNLDAVLSIEKQPVYVYKIPTDVLMRTIPFDSVHSVVFTYKEECYKGGPFQMMFKNPNKFRRVDMTDGEFKH